MLFVFLSCGLALPLAAQQSPAPRLEPLAVSQIEEGRRQQRAQQPGEPLPVTRIDEQQRTTSALDRGQPFSLSFSEPQPIKDLLLVLVRGTNLSVVVEPGIDGTFVGELNNVTLRQALDAILHPLGLDYSIEGNLIRVFKRRIETRIFFIDHVTTRRSGSRGLSASSSAGGGGTTTAGGVGGAAAGGAGVAGTAAGGGGGGSTGSGGGSGATVGGTDTGDLFDELSNGIKGTLLSADGKFNLDRKAGILQVTDYPDRLDQIAQYLETYLVRSHRQVQIQAKVIEVVLQDDSQFGINWSTVFSKAAGDIKVTQNLAPSTSGAFTVGLNIFNFQGLLSAFASQGKVNVLSSPRVIAMNNEPAIMRVGTQDVFFVTTSQVDATSGRVLQTTVTPQAITEGVVLSVTPQVSADGIINMSISPSITERTGQATSRLGDTVPIVSVRETDTIVRVREGETIVIAGLMQDRLSIDTSKVPIAGDLPLVGGLFRRQEKSKRKTDLVILLTPTILNPGLIADFAATDQERLYLEQKQADRPPVKK